MLKYPLTLEPPGHGLRSQLGLEVPTATLFVAGHIMILEYGLWPNGECLVLKTGAAHTV